MSKFYSEKEDEFIRTNYKKLTATEIAEQLERSKAAIYSRAKKLGLISTVPRRGDLTGQKFGKLTVVESAETDRNGHKKWTCLCECGNQKTILATHLVKNKIKSCGCLKQRRNNEHPNFKGHGEIHAQYFKNIEINAQHRKRTPIPFEITIEYIWDLFLKQDRKCALSGMPISFPAKSTGLRSASLDRIDSSKGYVEGNVQWLHKDVNMIKGSYSQKYFLEICKKIVDTTDKCEII